MTVRESNLDPNPVGEAKPSDFVESLYDEYCQFFQEFVDAFTADVAVVDEAGSIILVNSAWRARALSRTSATDDPTLDWLSSDERTSRRFQGTLNAVLWGSVPDAEIQFALSSEDHDEHFRLHLMPLQHGEFKGAIIVNEDVSALHDLHRDKRRLISQLMQSEEKERARIAREMHDSTAQDLVAISLNLSRLGRVDSDAVQDVVTDIRSILTRAQQDIRTMSYLLHPPLLDEGGLKLALASLVGGLSSRMEVRVRFECDCGQSRFPIDTETVLYRIAQEALINVHKHSSARSAVVRCGREGKNLVLEVEDDGIGFDVSDHQTVNLGVGIHGMRARLGFLGGTLTLSKANPGTILKAVIPTLEVAE
jgi:two-component system NarL family sensor kinase